MYLLDNIYICNVAHEVNMDRIDIPACMTARIIQLYVCVCVGFLRTNKSTRTWPTIRQLLDHSTAASNKDDHFVIKTTNNNKL